jgi:hypothetical protein
MFSNFRRVFLDLHVEVDPFVKGLETLEEAVASFLHMCFIADMEYPTGAGVLCTLLQRSAAKLDENGTKTAMTRKSKLNKNEKAREFSRAWKAYCEGVVLMRQGSRK